MNAPRFRGDSGYRRSIVLVLVIVVLVKIRISRFRYGRKKTQMMAVHEYGQLMAINTMYGDSESKCLE